GVARARKGGGACEEVGGSLFDASGEIRVELDPVTGLEAGVLETGRTSLRTGAERADALAQLDRSGAVAEPQADQAVHARRTLPRSSWSNARVRALGVDVGGTFTD